MIRRSRRVAVFLRLCLYSFGLTARGDQPMKSLRLQVPCDGSAQSTDEPNVCSPLITHVNLTNLGNLQLSVFSLICSFFNLYHQVGSSGLSQVCCLLRASCAGQAIQILFLDTFCSWLFLFTKGRNTISVTFPELSNRWIFLLTLVANCICVDFHAFVCFCFVLVFSCLSCALLFGSSLYFKLLRTDSVEYLLFPLLFLLLSLLQNTLFQCF